MYYTRLKMKNPKNLKLMNLPPIDLYKVPGKEALWDTVPIEDEIAQIYHYVDKSKSFRTTYGKMNEWYKMTGGRDARTGVPVTMSDGNWQQIDHTFDPQRRSADDYNNKFKKAYADLTSKIAYRYPNPGLPRIRQGRIGGSWRHIKEVLGHGGSRVVFVDGLVSTYDQENFNQALNGQIPYRPHLKTSLYSHNKIDVAATRQNIESGPASRTVKLPAVEELPMMSENERARKMAIQSPHKHKGFYRYN